MFLDILVYAGVVALFAAPVIVVVWWEYRARAARRFVGEYLTDLLRPLRNHLRRPIAARELKPLYYAGDYEGMIRYVQHSMHLDLNIKLNVVDDGAAPLWVQMPAAMPPYGTSAFRNTTAQVFVRRDILQRRPFSWTVFGIAHELSHIVLNSINHPLRQEEKAVDLTAMIFGYQNFAWSAETRERMPIGIKSSYSGSGI